MKTEKNILDALIKILHDEKGESLPDFQNDRQKEDCFRSLCNVRPPLPVSDKFLALQDHYLQGKSIERTIIDVSSFDYDDSIAVWQGDISRINSDVIVNACNSALLGCFHPLHNCIDNVIHSNAGIQVRRDCHEMMQGSDLPNGEVVITPAYNLPSKYIFHTVGPIIRDHKPTQKDMADLSRCYRSCLDKGVEMDIETIAFCCLSTGVYGYPQSSAAELAVATVRAWLLENNGVKVIFNVFQDKDKEHYERQLSR